MVRFQGKDKNSINLKFYSLFYFIISRDFIVCFKKYVLCNLKKMQAGVFELGNLQTCFDLKGREWRNV